MENENLHDDENTKDHVSPTPMNGQPAGSFEVPGCDLGVMDCPPHPGKPRTQIVFLRYGIFPPPFRKKKLLVPEGIN
jgi:hypothetical protein